MTTKSCAHPGCTCQAEPGKEFCSDSCRNAPVTGGKCPCGHAGCGGKAQG